MINKQEYKDIIEKVNKQVTEELKNKITPNMLGYRYYFDLRKKEILYKEYGINWKTLQEKNEGYSID